MTSLFRRFMRDYGRWWMPACVACLGVIFSIALWWMLTGHEAGLVEARVKLDAEESVAAFEREFGVSLGVIDALAAFYSGSEQVEKHEFKTFTLSFLVKYPEIKSLQWIKRVSAADREIFPVTFVEPFDEYKEIINFDLYSKPLVKQLLNRARDAGEKTTAVAPLLLSEAGNTVENVPARNVVIVQPVFRANKPIDSIELRREHLTGYLVGVYNVSSILRASVRQSGKNALEMAYYVGDLFGKERKIAEYRGATDVEKLRNELQVESLHSVTLQRTIAGLDWRIVSFPTAGYHVEFGTRMPIAVLLMGFLTTGFLASYLHLLNDRARAVEKLVQQLENQRSFLRQVIDLNPNLIFAKDRSGRFTLVNKAVADAYGTTVAELEGKTDADFNSNLEEVEHFRQDDLKVMDSLVELVIPEEVLSTASGERIWLHTVKRAIVEEDGTADQLLGVASDVTAQKMAAEESARIAAIVEASDDAIIGGTIERQIASWNSAAERMYGYSAEEVIGKPLLVVIPPEKAHELDSIFEKLVKGERIENFETVRMRKDGSRLEVSLTISPIRDKTGDIVATAAIARDISERRKTERELERYREQLEEVVNERTRELAASQDLLRQSERMASIGALAAGVAHEINNPIGAMLLTAENALEQSEVLKSEEQRLELFQLTCNKIVDKSKRCSLILKGVLQFAKKESTEKWPNDLNSITNGALQLIRDYVDTSRATISLNLDERLPPVCVNPVDIGQVLINLIKNSVENSKKDPHIRISSSKTSDGVLLTVEDQGKGIEEQRKRHIFDPFYTTRQHEGGTGLGLSIVHGIVTDHGGSIEVDSEPNHGTKVSITLPAA